MKYLLTCPRCSSKISVQAGQAGQQVRCTCGQDVEVPSVRHLRELEPVTEEESTQRLWTVGQGIVFLGLAILIIAVVAGGAILVLRPANGDTFTLKIDKDAIRREVTALTPTQEYSRLETVTYSIPGYAEQLSQGALPTQLLPCLKLLAALEGSGPEPLAPLATAELAKEAGKRAAQLAARQDLRRTMNDWLWLVGLVAIIGILLASSSLLLPAARPRRKAVVGNRR